MKRALWTGDCTLESFHLGWAPRRKTVLFPRHHLFQLDNKNIGPVFVAVRYFSQLVFPVGCEHEEASILRNVTSRGRPEAVPGGAIRVGKPPNFGSLAIDR